MRHFRKTLYVLAILFSTTGYGQIIELYHRPKKVKPIIPPVRDSLFMPGIDEVVVVGTKEKDKPKVLKSGFVDFLTDGNMQAAANLLRLVIGPRNGFNVPFFIYTGATGNAFGTETLNKTTVLNLLNPIGGSVNMSFNGTQDLTKSSQDTKLHLAYQLGGRLVSGKDSVTKAGVNMMNGFANLGFLFQTVASTEDDTSNLGTFFVQGKIIGSVSSSDDLRKVFGSAFNKSVLIGYSIDAGIEIDKVINARIGVYKYTNGNGLDLFNKPVIKLSLDYGLQKK